MIGSGKAVIRTAAKHERRRRNDIALVRNFMNTVQDQEVDSVWLGIVCKILNINCNINWAIIQNNRYVGVPNWFWSKVDRIRRENNLHTPTAVNAHAEYMSSTIKGMSLVREISFSRSYNNIDKLAKLLDIEITCIGNRCIIPVATRMRNFKDIPLTKKFRVGKPKERYASTEEIDMKLRNEGKVSVDAMLAKIPVLESEVERLGRELAIARDNLDYTRESIRSHLSDNYGI